MGPNCELSHQGVSVHQDPHSGFPGNGRPQALDVLPSQHPDVHHPPLLHAESRDEGAAPAAALVLCVPPALRPVGDYRGALHPPDGDGDRQPPHHHRAALGTLAAQRLSFLPELCGPRLVHPCLRAAPLHQPHEVCLFPLRLPPRSRHCQGVLGARERGRLRGWSSDGHGRAYVLHRTRLLHVLALDHSHCLGLLLHWQVYIWLLARARGV
mmetsp:Transcript_88179/g.244725  ORF Transcript_88179/g.244725 Transcript_88179/m.244725 type:complete len:211 (+) Transcript_88179:1831-2463(+)